MITESFKNLEKYYKNMEDFRLERHARYENMSDVFVFYRLQGMGVAIVLQLDGTWYFEDTSGG